MGAARRKRRRFLEEHPYCCFCGGGALATTIDHVPNRACFLGRAFPEGFEFPACGRCQDASRTDELAFAFAVRMCDTNSANYDSDESDRAITGLANNLRHLLPNPFLSANEKRRAWRGMGLAVPPGEIVADLPVVEINPAIHAHVLRYARKLAVALYYREKGRIAPPDRKIMAAWTQSSNQKGMRALRGFVEITPRATVGRRTNLDFGDQFNYHWDASDEPDLMAALVRFGQGVVLGTAVADPEAAARVGESKGWAWVALSEITTAGDNLSLFQKRHQMTSAQ